MFTKLLKKGTGIPIVFLHGFLGKSEDWLPVSSHLSSPCIGCDLPGHGNTPFKVDFTIPIPNYHLVGYSMGGRIALQKFAKKALSLTLLSVHPGLKTEEEKEKRLKSDKEWANLLLKLPIDEFLLRWYDQPVFKPFKPDLKMRREQNVQDLAKALLEFSLAKQSYFEIDQGLIGEFDQKFLSLYKNPIVIPEAGHMVHLENPKAVAKMIEKRCS